MLEGVGVVRVDLDGKVLPSVDELDEDGQFRPSPAGLERVSSQPFRMPGQDPAQGLPIDAGFPVRMGAALPGLSQGAQIDVLAEIVIQP